MGFRSAASRFCGMGFRSAADACRRLMRKLGLWAVRPKRNTSKRHPEHKVYPYLLRGRTIDQPNQVWAADITYIPISLIERRNALEFMRDHAAELFEIETGSAWRPRGGSMLSHRTLTASVIDTRDFIAARRRADTELLAPAGARIAFTGGTDCNDVDAIWAALDKVRAKHADMVLFHGGSPRGAERIAACWADQRKVPQVVYKPDWAREGRAAPLQTQRPPPRSAADRRGRVSWQRHLRQPRR
jgi:hypothetical protein